MSALPIRLVSLRSGIVLALIAALFVTAAAAPTLADAAPKNSKSKKKHKKKGKKKPKQVKAPAGLKFYKPPKKLPKQHGKLIWSRKSTGVVPLKSAAWTKTVLYTSKTPAGKLVAVSGTVSVPRGKAPKGGWPVITYAHGTTGIADKCAPSRNTANGPATSYISYTDPALNAWLKAGYAVARTDYQGLGTPGVHAFMIGKAAGRGVLDIVRAARGLDPKIGKRYLIAGHSQGGHAALFAAGDAATWVPDLTLKGTVAYAPASHLAEQAGTLGALTQPSSITALASLIVRGAESVSSAIKPAELLSDPVLALYPQTDVECLSGLTGLAAIAPSEMIRDGADLTALTSLLAEQNPAVKTAAPVFVAQGTADTTTFPFLTNLLVDELQDEGDDVDYVTYEGVDHGPILDAAQTDVMAWFKEKLPSGR